MLYNMNVICILCGKWLFDVHKLFGVQVVPYWSNFALFRFVMKFRFYCYPYWKLNVCDAQSNAMITFMKTFMET